MDSRHNIFLQCRDSIRGQKRNLIGTKKKFLLAKKKKSSWGDVLKKDQYVAQKSFIYKG